MSIKLSCIFNEQVTETRSGRVDGMQAAKLIKEQFPDMAVLVLTENLNDSNVIDAIHAGEGDYIFPESVKCTNNV